MRLSLTSVFVDDQEKAFEFYTKKLGFKKRRDIKIDDSRWLSVYSEEGGKSIELMLEPNSFETAKRYQSELFNSGIPINAFEVDDVEVEHNRLLALDVDFTIAPSIMGVMKVAIFNDTCGNLIQIYQLLEE
ncbi:MAG: hypothetical protein SCALA702_32680 [Melioribacteraceae bacterium]|nr:MAG: hypothetical protein SCALA702_32680 [Melioribacteraceae bacterium]